MTCAFIDDDDDDDDDGATGAASIGNLQNTDVSITSNDFSGNSVTSTGSDGGALIFGRVTDGNIEMSKNMFTANEAESRGGAVAIQDVVNTDVTVERNHFTGNNVTNGGGALFIEEASDGSDVTISRNRFRDNMAMNRFPSGNGGAILVTNIGETGPSDMVDFIISKNRFSGNKAGNNGGATYIDDVFQASVSIAHNYFSENESGFNGGALLANDVRLSTFTVTRCDFKNNESTSNLRRGGAIALEQFSDTDVLIDKSFFKSNSAGDGGAVFMEGIAGGTLQTVKITIADSDFFENTTGEDNGQLGGTLIAFTFSN